MCMCMSTRMLTSKNKRSECLVLTILSYTPLHVQQVHVKDTPYHKSDTSLMAACTKETNEELYS